VNNTICYNSQELYKLEKAEFETWQELGPTWQAYLIAKHGVGFPEVNDNTHIGHYKCTSLTDEEIGDVYAIYWDARSKFIEARQNLDTFLFSEKNWL
jgi:hypothetical protein